MGMSSSGVLLYGIYLGEETLPWANEYNCEGEIREDFDERLAAVDELGEYMAIMDGKHNIPYKEQRTLEEAAPVEIVYAGYHDYPHYFLALRGTHEYAYGYGFEELDLYAMLNTTSSGLFTEAVEFCEKYKLGDFRQAKWFLTSSYG